MTANMGNKVVVITGGSSGIGMAAAAAFLREGAKVAICGRDQGRLNSAAESLTEISGSHSVYAHPCDVLDEEAVAGLSSAVKNCFGRCDALICNAGQARTSNFYTTRDKDWLDEFELKFFSVLRPVRAFIDLLEASGAGSIVCTSAMLARTPEPFLIATGATRAGQLNLLKSLSREFAPRNVRVNAVLIGLVDSGQWSSRYERGEGPDGTKIPDGMSKEDWFKELANSRHIPMGRIGTPSEAANAILFFASPMASYITGETIEVTGGQARNV
ncbi:MAG: Glucose 1-dehydrogenase [Alphaproteobacteria bacterium MarineAlpha11_Bin1]|nr:MAG: Glucose 1-dehydrogenase [Alphaproteobacteria bacterium MarineAlpha11_Bin1]